MECMRRSAKKSSAESSRRCPSSRTATPRPSGAQVVSRNGATAGTSRRTSRPRQSNRLCLQAVQLAGLDHEDYSVEYVAAPDDSDDDSDQAVEVSSQAKLIHLAFWTEVRAALLATGKLRSLRSPHPCHWFDIGPGRSGIHLSLTANTLQKRVGVKVVLRSEKAERALSAPARAARSHRTRARRKGRRHGRVPELNAFEQLLAYLEG